MAGGALAALALCVAHAAPALAQAGGRLDRGFMVGRWTDDGNCANAAALGRDGTFLAANGATGFWHLDGDRLIMTGSSTMVLRITRHDANRIGIVNPDGSPGASTRCPGGDSGGGAAFAVSRAYLVGRWTDTHNCSDAVNFRADGRFVVPNGAAGGWTLDGDRLTMSGSSTVTMRLSPIGPGTLMVINSDGTLGRSTRC